MPTVRRGVPIMLLLIALVVASSAAESTALGGGGSVAVTRTALFKGGLGLANYGLVLHNNSRTADAFGISVTVKAFDAHGHMLTSDQEPITMIPSATDFVLNGVLAWNIAISAARISTAVNVEQLLPKGRMLPRFTDIKVGFDSLTGKLTNPYAKRMPLGAKLYALFFDTQGRIVDTGSDETTLTLLPHQTIPYTLDGDALSPSDATTAEVSVDPCGDLLTGVCPVSSATPSKPVAMTADALRKYSVRTGQRLYWAGPETGVKYEYRETDNGYIYLRYLTGGATIGNKNPDYLTVATYPTLDAYAELQSQLRRPGWATVPVRPHVIAVYERTKPTNVHVAFAGQAYQIEVYDPTPGAAIALVRAGRIRPIN